MAFINITLILCIPLILRVYDVAPEAAVLAREVMLIHGGSAILLWIPSFMIPYFLRAAGDATYTMVVSMLTMWLVRVLGAYVIGRYLGYGRRVVRPRDPRLGDAQRHFLRPLPQRKMGAYGDPIIAKVQKKKSRAVTAFLFSGLTFPR